MSSVHEYLFQIEQTIYREHPDDAGNRQGVAVFAGYYPRFPGDQIVDESIGDSYIAGVVVRGLYPGRDDDVIGIGVAHSELYRGGTNQETVTEVFYKAELNSRLSLQPDLQYIASPSGILRDSLAVGLRFQITL